MNVYCVMPEAYQASSRTDYYSNEGIANSAKVGILFSRSFSRDTVARMFETGIPCDYVSVYSFSLAHALHAHMSKTAVNMSSSFQ